MSARKLPHLNVAVIGHHGHGKTTLVAALTQLAARLPGNVTRPMQVTDLAKGGFRRRSGETETVETAQVALESGQRHSALADCPGRPARHTATAVGTSGMDAAILVVSAVDSVMAQTREHVLLAREGGATRFVVFLNQCDRVDDPELIDVAEVEVRQLLVDLDLPGDDALIIRGAALPALAGDVAWASPIRRLLDALDHELPLPARHPDAAPVFAIQKVYPLRQGEPIVTGHLLRGTVRSGDTLALLGLGRDPSFVSVTSLEIFHERVASIGAGDCAGLRLRGMNRSQVTPVRGMVLAGPPALEPSSRFVAGVRLLDLDEGGRHTPIRNHHEAHFYLGTAGLTGRMLLPKGLETLAPGSVAPGIEIELRRPTRLEIGMRFSFKDGTDGLRHTRGGSTPIWGGTAGTGTITAVIAG